VQGCRGAGGSRREDEDVDPDDRDRVFAGGADGGAGLGDVVAGFRLGAAGRGGAPDRVDRLCDRHVPGGVVGLPLHAGELASDGGRGDQMSLRPGHPLWPRFLPTPVVVSLATVGPVGRIRRAPGTWGSVAGLLYFVVLFAQVSPWLLILWSALGLWLAVGICGEAEFRLGLRDPGMVVLDE